MEIKMLEFFGVLFTAYLLTWPALAILFVVGILFEHNDWRGFAVFVALISGVSAYFYFAIPLVMMAMYVVGSLVAGLLWSVWRYKRHVTAKVAEVKNGSQRDRELMAARLLPAAMWSTIVAWVIVWPFSFVEYFIRDVIDLLEMAVKKLFKGVYNKIYDSAVAQLGLK